MQIGSYRIYLKNKDLLILVLMFGWATAYYFETGNMGQAKLMLALIQPVFFLMLGLLALYLFNTLKIEKIQPEDRRATAAETAALPVDQIETERQDGQLAPIHKKRLFGFFGMTVLYVLLFDIAGFIPATILYVSGTTYFLGLRHRPSLVLIPTVTALLIYFIFATFFYIDLPGGVFQTIR